MDTLTLQFKCGECGTPLEVEHEYPGIIEIFPCSKCLDATEYDKGYQDGYQAGLVDAD